MSKNGGGSHQLSSKFLRNSPKQAVTFILIVFIMSLLYYYFSIMIQERNYGFSTSFDIDSLTSAKELLEDEIVVPFREILKGVPIMLAQNDSRILNYIGKHGIVQPPSDLPYNLKNPKKNPSMGQGQYIQKLFKNMKNGFFVECGGLDGETRSNSLYLEKELGWKGLLVEGDPKNYELLHKKNRKCWTAKACLALKPYPHEVVFMQHFNLGRILEDGRKASQGSKLSPVTCYPFFTLLSYLNVTTVDYFSLDVEGNELDVLRTIPFDSVFIKTLSVEFSHVNEGKVGVKEFMKRLGYIHVKTITHLNNLANDFLFVHPSLTDLLIDKPLPDG